jgi:hypothetical protein
LSHLKLLFKLFKLDKWILIDNKQIEYDISKYENVKFHNLTLDQKNIKIINDKYTNDFKNKHVLYICNNNYTIYDTNIHLVNQMKIAIQFNPKLMILNLRFPKSQTDYDPNIYKDYDYYLYKFEDLQLDKQKYSELFLNIDLKTDDPKELLYVKGDMLIALYQHKDDNSFRLIIRPNNNKYELKIYNLTDIYDKYHYFSQFLSYKFLGSYETNETNEINKINIDYFKLIPGYDGCIQNIMEFFIYNDYLNNIKQINDQIKTFKLISDINLKLKKYTKHSILSYEYDDTLFKYNYIWKKIAKVNKNISIHIQYNVIKQHESESKKILGSKRIKKNLKMLKKHKLENEFMYFKM